MPRSTALAVGVGVVIVLVAATVALVGRPGPTSAPADPYTSGHADLAVPGEFILAPGNLAPVGIAVALPPNLMPLRGEYRAAKSMPASRPDTGRCSSP